MSLIWRNVAVYYDDTGDAVHFGEEAEIIRRDAKLLEADFTRRWETFDPNKAAGRGGGGGQTTAAPAVSVSPEKSPPSFPSAAPLTVSSARPSPSPTLIVIKKAPAAVQLPADGKLQQRDTAEGSQAEGGGLQVRVKKEEPSDQLHPGVEPVSGRLSDSQLDMRRSASPSPLHSASSASAQPGESASIAMKMEMDATGARRIPKKAKEEPHTTAVSAHPSLHPASSDISAVNLAAAPTQPRARGPSPIPFSAPSPTTFSASAAAPFAVGPKASTSSSAARGGAQSTSCIARTTRRRLSPVFLFFLSHPPDDPPSSAEGA